MLTPTWLLWLYLYFRTSELKRKWCNAIFFQKVFIPGFVALKFHKMVKTCKFILISNSDIDNFVSKWTALYNCTTRAELIAFWFSIVWTTGISDVIWSHVKVSIACIYRSHPVKVVFHASWKIYFVGGIWNMYTKKNQHYQSSRSW